MYTSLKQWVDLQDGRHVYKVGDEYPRAGYSPTAERIAQLAGEDNLQHRPLIAENAQKAPEKPLEVEAKEEPKETAEPLKKGTRRRRRAKA